MTLSGEAAASALLVAEGGCAIAVAWRLARRWCPYLLEFSAVGLLLVMVQVVGIPVVLASVDLLGRWPVAIAHAVLAVGVLALPGPSVFRRAVFRRAVFRRAVFRRAVFRRAVFRRAVFRRAVFRRARASRLVTMVAVGSAVAVGVIWLQVALAGGIPAESDTVQYHIAAVALWFRVHNLWHLPLALPGVASNTFPGNGEMAAVWSVLPSGRDQLAYATPLAFAALAVAGVALLAREMRSSPGAAALAALAVVTCPILWFGSVFSLQTDLAGAAGLVMAVAMLLRYRRDPTPTAAALGGLALGLGVGAKYTVAVPAALLVLIAGAIGPRRRDLWWAVPGIVALAGPWLLRNAIDTGNPIFPQRIAFLPGAITPLALADTRLLTHVLRGHTAALGRWVDVARTWLGPAAILSVVGIAAGWRRRGPALVVTVMALGAAISYLFAPYSGGGPGGGRAWMAAGIRYLVPALLLGAALCAAALPAVVVAWSAAATLAWNLWWAYGHQLRRDTRPGTTALMIGAAFGVATALILVPRRPLPVARLGWRVSAGAAAALLAVDLLVVAYNHRDAHTAPSGLEALVDRVAAPRQAVIVLALIDERSVVGAGLRRPLVGVAAGGRAGEEPFGQPPPAFIAYLETGNLVAVATPPPTAADRALGRRLDAAIARTGLRVLVVSSGTIMPLPIGWAPDPTVWCLAGVSEQTSVFVADRSLCIAP